MDDGKETGTLSALLHSLFGINKYRVLRCFFERERLFKAAQSLESNPDTDIDGLSITLGYISREELVQEFKEYFLVSPGLYAEYVKKRHRGVF